MKKWILGTTIVLQVSCSTQQPAKTQIKAETKTEAESAPASVPLAIDRSVIKEVVNKKNKQLRSCVDTAMIVGKVTHRWRIQKDGTVSQVSQTVDTIHDNDVTDCIIGILKTLTFPPPRNGIPVVVDYPFIFTSGEAIVCREKENQTVDGVTFDNEVSVNAFDECTLTITNSVINSSEVAFVVRGNATVIIEDSIINAPLAISADGSSRIKLLRSAINGTVNLRENAVLEPSATVFATEILLEGDASVIDGGRNTFGKSPE